MCGKQKSENFPLLHSHDCLPAIVPALCLYMPSRFVLATTDRDTGIREPEPPAQGHTAGPGMASGAAWPAEPCSVSSGPHRSPGGRAFWSCARSGPGSASAELSAGTSCPRSDPQLIPPSRTRGQQDLAVPSSPGLWGLQLDTHPPPSPPPPSSGKGRCTWCRPGAPGERGGLCEAVLQKRSCLPRRPRLAQAGVKIHLHSQRTAWQMVGEEAGCLRGRGVVCSRRPAGAPEQRAHHHAGVLPHPHSLLGVRGPGLCFF